MRIVPGSHHQRPLSFSIIQGTARRAFPGKFVYFPSFFYSFFFDLFCLLLVSQCSATVRHCSCYTHCSATPFYDIDMANLRCYPPPPKRTEAAATVPFLRPFQGSSATVVRHCENRRPKVLHKYSATAVARHPCCSV